MARKTGPRPTFTPEFAREVWRLYVTEKYTARDVAKAMEIPNGSVAYLVKLHDKTLPEADRFYKETKPNA
jgi:transposase-like protein